MDFYFAYGNNMSSKTMLDRVGSGHFQFISLAKLDGFRLTFTTETPEWGGPVADLSQVEGGAVYGVLYQVDQVAWDKLEPHEPTYAKKQLPVSLLSTCSSDAAIQSEVQTGEAIEATVYFVPLQLKMPERPPVPEYLNRVVSAAKERGLPRVYIEHLMSHS